MREYGTFMRVMDGKLMKTDSSLCVGCNKCIFRCPTHANDAVIENGDNKIHVNYDLCIWCGECLEVCDHQARRSADDTESFFDALDAGEQISVIAAPALRYNIPEYRNLFGYLKNRGVNLFYDVSFGADITVWRYLKELRGGRKTMIAQPCPVVVRYIEHFKPELIPCLAPVQSPAVCAAIYLKKYQDCTDKLAFLSPCIGKTTEITDDNTGGYITYNVTYKGLLEYLEEKGINLSQYEEHGFDSPKGSLGTVFSKPGGLTENVRLHMGEDVWIRQVSGTMEVPGYLEEYLQRMKKGLPVPTLVDALNCKNGCNLGTATRKTAQIDDIAQCMNRERKEAGKKEAEALFDYFDEQLDPADFRRSYRDQSLLHEEASEEAIEHVFLQMEKDTKQEQSVNCFSCGYGSCRKFAAAVALGQNHIENCFQYTKLLLARQKKELAEKHQTILSSLIYASKIQRNLLPNEESMNEAFPEHRVLWYPRDIVGGDIYWLKNFKDGALLCVCDCTGHGTPGALLSMLVVSVLDSVVRETNYKDTAYILWALDQRMKGALNVAEAEKADGWQSVTDINDGADLALMFVHNSGEVTVSAGNIHVFVCDGNRVFDVKGQRLRIGSGKISGREEVRQVVIPPNPANKYYVASDGLFDQIGEKTKLPFGYRKFKDIILKDHEESLANIFEKVWHEYEAYRGKECRRDDVALVGFRP